MQAWKNIFDLGDWQVYVRFQGAEVTDPNSEDYWVKAEDLDPAVGTVQVVAGQIVCEFIDTPESEGLTPSIAVFPLDPVASGIARLTCSGADAGMLDDVDSSAFGEMLTVTEAAPEAVSIDASPTNTYVYATSAEWADTVQTPVAIAVGSGLGWERVQGTPG